MPFDVPVRVSGPIDKGTLSRPQPNSSLNRIRQPLDRNTISQSAVNSPYASVDRTSGRSSAPPPVRNNQPAPQSYPQARQPVAAGASAPPVRTAPPVHSSQPAAQSYPQTRQPAAVQAPPPAPAPRRRAPAAPSVTELMRGQKWTVADKTGRVPSSIKVCVGWDILDGRCELDASAFMLGENDKVPSDDWFIFYGQTNSPDGGVRYSSNADNRNAPDDAELNVQLNRVQPQINKIAVCVTIYEASSKRLHFGMIKNLYARILDERGTEIARFLLKDCSDQVTAMVVGELYRYKGAWKFNAVGSGVKRDLAEFCGMYGVNLE